MARYACPICGDPNAYIFWVDPEPPEGCPDDDVWHGGGAPSIKNVTECKFQMKKAWQAAEFRKLVPDAFDRNGKMKPGELARVLEAFAKAHPGAPITL
jgi:hypothetical protein